MRDTVKMPLIGWTMMLSPEASATLQDLSTRLNDAPSEIIEKALKVLKEAVTEGGTGERQG